MYNLRIPFCWMYFQKNCLKNDLGKSFAGSETLTTTTLGLIFLTQEVTTVFSAALKASSVLLIRLTS